MQQLKNYGTNLILNPKLSYRQKIVCSQIYSDQDRSNLAPSFLQDTIRFDTQSKHLKRIHLLYGQMLPVPTG